MRKPLLSVVFGLILLTTVVLPPFIHMVFHTSSMAVGTFLVSGLYIFLFVAVSAITLRQSQRRSASPLRLIAVMLGVVMIQGSISFLINDGFDFGRFMQSYLLLIIYFLAAFSFVLLAQKVPNFQIDFAVKLVFYVLLLLSIAGILNYSPFSPEFSKPVFVFSEPSIYALSFLPFLLYMMVTFSPRVKLLLSLLGYAIALLLENMTLVFGITLITGLVLPLRRLLFLIPIAVILIFFSGVNLDYYVSRGNLRGSQNLSTLVYLSGWERAYMNFKDTFGIGIGFQQFGIIGSRGKLMSSIEELAGSELNLLDGGAVAPKLIGEFGGLGVGMLIVYFAYSVKNLWWLRSMAMGRIVLQDYKQVFFRSCLLMYSVDLFVRGLGYFTSEGFMFFASLIWILYFRSRKLDREVVSKICTS